MNIRKPLMLAGAAVTVGLASAGGISAVSAHPGGSESGLADRLVQKFSLNKEEVQAVLDEERQAHREEMGDRMSDRLQKLVDEGKLTSEQKTLIEEKHKELQASGEERHDELKAWAEENGIDLQYLMGGRGRKGMGEGMGRH